MTTVWKYAYASIAGTYHKRMSISCQDYCIIRVIYTGGGEPVLVITASDGAGSVKYPEIGSKLLCGCLMEEIKDFFKSGKCILDLTRPVVEEMVKGFHQEAGKLALSLEGDRHDFACTLLSAVVAIDGAVFFQIGDGAIVISTGEEPEFYFPVFWPLKGEYENTTYYAVDGESSLKFMKYKFIEGVVHEVAVLTDGLQRLALDYRDQSAHSMFFSPIFKHLRFQPEGCRKTFVDSLSDFLNSKRVMERTDDDKTLIIAARCDV